MILKVKKENYNFKIGEDNLEIVDSFKYLGINFSYNRKFKKLSLNYAQW